MDHEVLIVDDSFFARRVLGDMVEKMDRFVVGESVSSGAEALNILDRQIFDAVTLDVEMPEMDGLETLKRIKDREPDIPVLMVSSLTTENAEVTTHALEEGALDVIPKPSSGPSGTLEEIEDELHMKLRAAVRGSSKRTDKPNDRKNDNSSSPAASSEESEWELAEKFEKNSPKALLIGGSTGAPPVLRSIVSSLSGSYPLPVVLIQHISEPFLSQLADNYSELTDLSIQQVVTSAPLESGTIYLPKDDAHLKIKQTDNTPILKSEEGSPVSGALPSIDVLFNSASRVLGKECIAVLLSGMGKDGAEGMNKIHDLGGLCLVQDEETSSVFGMPAEAHARGGVDLMAPSGRIPEIILDWTKKSLKF